MVYTLTDKTKDRQQSGLMTYSIRRDAVHHNPADTSMAVPSMGLTVAVREDENPEDLMGRTFELTDRSGSPTTGTAVDYSLNEGTGVVSLDTSTVFDNLNTEQTCFPIVGAEGNDLQWTRILAYWAQECGVFMYPVPGIVRTYIGSYTEFGYELDNNARWIHNGNVATLTDGSTTAPIHLGPSQPIMFGAVLTGTGTGTTSTVTWSFPLGDGTTTLLSLERRGTSLQLRQAGVLIGSVTELASMSTWTEKEVHVKAEVLVANPTQVRFTMRVLVGNSDDNAYNTATFTQSTPSVLLRGVGYNKITTTGGGTYLSRVYNSIGGALPTVGASQAIDLGDGSAQTVPVSAIQGYTGNVWSHMREFCSIYGINMWLQNDMIYLSSMLLLEDGALPLAHPAKSQVRKNLSRRTRARKVEVVQYNLKPSYLTASILLWKAENVYSVEKGETKVEVIQSDSTFTQLMQPVAVSGVPVPYTSSYSSYVVTGADGYIVDPQWWYDNGGSIKVAATRKSGEIELTIQAPNVESVRAPYRISEGVADRPALYVMGKGIAHTSDTVEIYTASADAAQEVGITFDSPFVADIETAYNTGTALSKYFGGTGGELSFSVPINTGAEQTNPYGPDDLPGTLGYRPEGAYLYHRGAIYRTVTTTTNPSVTQATAESSTLIAYLNEAWKGKKVGDFNAYHAGKNVREMNRAPLPLYIS